MSSSDAPVLEGTRFSHVVVNVSDLDRSASYYEMATSLRRAERTKVSNQRFASLDIPRGSFDGWLMRDLWSELSPAVHLVQWQNPEPTGTPYPNFWHVGNFRICTKGGDVLRVYDELVAGGARPFTKPLLPVGQNITGRPAFSGPDPDGVVLQNVSLPGERRLYHTAINCSHLGPSRRFYELLGLSTYLEATTEVPATNHFGPGEEPSTFDAVLMEAPGIPSADEFPVFSLDLCEWTLPKPVGTPYPTQHNLGIVRLGLCAADLDRALAVLAEQGASVTEPETRDFGPEVGTRAAVIVKDPDGATVELVDQPV